MLTEEKVIEVKMKYQKTSIYPSINIKMSTLISRLLLSIGTADLPFYT